MTAEHIYHLALAAEWGKDTHHYRGSTIGRSLDEVGYVHASTMAQVRQTADRFYRGRDDVVLLVIAPDLLGVPVQYEETEEGQEFPHIYAPIPKSAVVAATPVRPGRDGFLELPDLS